MGAARREGEAESFAKESPRRSLFCERLFCERLSPAAARDAKRHRPPPVSNDGSATTADPNANSTRRVGPLRRPVAPNESGSRVARFLVMNGCRMKTTRDVSFATPKKKKIALMKTKARKYTSHRANNFFTTRRDPRCLQRDARGRRRRDGPAPGGVFVASAARVAGRPAGPPDVVHESAEGTATREIRGHGEPPHLGGRTNASRPSRSRRRVPSSRHRARLDPAPDPPHASPPPRVPSPRRSPSWTC